MLSRVQAFIVLLSVGASVVGAHAQIAVEDYERAAKHKSKYRNLALFVSGCVFWFAVLERLWYRRSVPGGNEFVLVDAEKQAKQPAFDHAKLAASLSQAANAHYTALQLPFTEV